MLSHPLHLRYVSFLSLFLVFARASPITSLPNVERQAPILYERPWNVAEWPFYLNVTISDGCQCRDFPDGISNWPEQYFEGSLPDLHVHCWQNGTIEDPAGKLYVRTDEGCYMHDDDIDFLGPDGKPIEDFDYTEHLPWCGPMRPYMYRWATDESALLPDMRKMNCYKCPSLNCTTALVPWMELDLYCWVDGTEVSNGTTNSNQWFQRAQRVGPDHDEKCWLPAKMIAPNPAPPSFFDVARTMPGSDGPCPEWEWDWDTPLP